MSKFKKYLPWAVIVLLALPMMMAGAAKLAGVPEMHQSFVMLGLPDWFGYFIGAAELAGGIALFVSRLSALAATGLIPIMAGAVYFHIAFAIPSAVPAAIFLVLSLVVIALKRRQAIWYPV